MNLARSRERRILDSVCSLRAYLRSRHTRELNGMMSSRFRLSSPPGQQNKKKQMVDRRRPRVAATPWVGVSRAVTAVTAAAAAAAITTLAMVATTSTLPAEAYVTPPADIPPRSSRSTAWQRGGATRPATTSTSSPSSSSTSSSFFRPKAEGTAPWTMFSSRNPVAAGAATDDASESERAGANARGASVGGGEQRGGQRRRSSSRRGRQLWASPGGDGELNGLEGERGVEEGSGGGAGGNDEGDSDAKVRGLHTKHEQNSWVFCVPACIFHVVGVRPPACPPLCFRRPLYGGWFFDSNGQQESHNSTGAHRVWYHLKWVHYSSVLHCRTCFCFCFFVLFYFIAC